MTAASPRSGAARQSAEDEPALVLKNVEKRFGVVKAVSDVSLSVPAGAFLVLLGPSGCGKSTLLRLLAGLEAPTGGTIHFAGQLVASAEEGVIVPPGKRHAGLVFQSYALWPHMTVGGNVEWPLKVARIPPKERKERVREVLDLLDIAPLADRYPSEISGGQQQRVAIARMVAPKPSILLFDEPLSNLDAKLRVEMRAELMKVHRATNATSVYVTHDQVEALTMATHIAVINGGLVEQIGTPMELIESPATAFVATFVGTPAANVVPVVAQGGDFLLRGVPIANALGLADGASAQAMYRAQDLSLVKGDPKPGEIEMILVEATPMVGAFVLTLVAGNLRLSVVAPQAPTAGPGQRLRVCFPSEPAVLFDAQGKRFS